VSRIASVFKNSGHKALIPYITVGYPDIKTTLKAVELLAAKGADIIELGIPFSDPMADGITIQDSSYQALLKGVNTDSCMEMVRQIRLKSEIPLVFMTYFNPILAYGIEKFCDDCGEAGIDGLIVPDLPPEEGLDLEKSAHKAGLDLIYLLAPTSTDNRIRLVSEKSRGYIYLVSVAGVTGARNSVPPDLGEFVTRVRHYARQPLCVGFGISTPEQAGQIAGIADGVIIGSKMIQLIKSDPTLKELSMFVQEIEKNINQGLGKDSFRV
jgi:tryptophan synthase alpha chain